MEGKSLSLKHVEHSLSRFNEVAVPHHLELLRQHKANIAKWSSEGEWGRVTREQARLQRAAAALRVELAELAALRARLDPAHAPRFDRVTSRARHDVLAALADCLREIESSCRALAARGARRPECSPVSINRDNSECCSEQVSGSAISSESVGVLVAGEIEGVSEEDGEESGAPLVQLRIDPDEYEAQLAERESALRGWARLRAELCAVRDLWDQLLQASTAQREQVQASALSTEAAAGNVVAARAHLSLADKLSGVSCAGGACVGALAGGPVGLALGAKLGALAALAGSALGALAARAVSRAKRDD